jgi:hypothetical protein
MILVLLATYISGAVKEEGIKCPEDGGTKPQLCQSTWLHVPQDMKLHQYGCENLNLSSHIVVVENLGLALYLHPNNPSPPPPPEENRCFADTFFLQPRNEFASPILVFAFKYSFC